MTSVQWLKKTFKESIQHHFISVPQWSHRGKLKLLACISYNDRGCFLSLTEFLPDRQSFTICIPKGRNTLGWTLFLNILPQLSLPTDNGGPASSEIPLQSYGPQQQHPIPPKPPNHNQQPWSGPAANIRVITKSSTPETSSNIDWAKAIISDSVESPFNLDGTAKAIASAWNFNFLPSLTLFGER